jgi:hypothetical protein
MHLLKKPEAALCAFYRHLISASLKATATNLKSKKLCRCSVVASWLALEQQQLVPITDLFTHFCTLIFGTIIWAGNGKDLGKLFIL